MQFISDKSLHQVSAGSNALKAEGENAGEQARTMGFAAERNRDAKAAPWSRRWRWAIGATCAAAVLVLFGLFHPRPSPQAPIMPDAGYRVAARQLAQRDANAAAMRMRSPEGAPTAAYSGFPQRMAAAPTRAQTTALTASSSAESPASANGPMIARTVSLTIQVKDVGGSRSALDAILARYQGYAAELNIYTPENGARSFSASLRIPAAALPAALAELRKLGRVQNESQSGEEVTQQHTDLVVRLNNARETEKRLIAILQQRTGKVSEVLEVEEQISKTRGEIERMEAELKALEHRVDFATVQLQLAEEFQAQLNPPSAAVGTRMRNAIVAGLSHGGESILGILLFFAEYGPALLVWCTVLGGPMWLAWRRYRKAERRATAN